MHNFRRYIKKCADDYIFSLVPNLYINWLKYEKSGNRTENSVEFLDAEN